MAGRLWVLLIFMMCLPVSQARAAETTTTIVAFGDSLFSGYGLAPEDAFPAQLERKLRDNGYNVTVINDGVAGDTSAGGVTRVDEVLAKRPDIILVEFGGNDLLRTFPPEETRKNLNTILAKIKQANIRMLLIGQRAPMTLGATYADAFNSMYPDLAKQYGAGLYPFFLEGVIGKPDMMQPDGVHPTKEGVDIMVDNVYPLVAAGLAKSQ